MSAADPPITASTHGDVLTAISDGMVALLKEFYGRGPTRAKSYFQDDLVVGVVVARLGQAGPGGVHHWGGRASVAGSIG